MLTVYTPDLKKLKKEEEPLELQENFVWIDLFNPPREEEILAERALKLNLPTREEMKEIEISNRLYKEKKSFETIVGESIAQTFVRSVNTSLTTILALVVLYIVGSESTRYFSLALIVGIVAGTYSSVFLGSPLLVTVEKWQNKGKK